MTTKEKIAQFFSQYPRKEFARGETILLAGEEVKTVQYLEIGGAVEYDITVNGEKAILNTFKPGAFFPMSNVVNEVSLAYFIEATERTKVRQAPADEVVQWLWANNDVLFDLLQRTYRGTDGLFARLAGAMHEDATERVINELVIAAKRFGYEALEGGCRLKQRITKVDLAQRTGLARETVSRVLKRLAEQGVVTSSEKRYVLDGGLL